MKNRFQEKIFLYPSLFILWRNNIGFIILWGGSIIMKHFYCRFASYYFEKFQKLKKKNRQICHVFLVSFPYFIKSSPRFG